MSLQEAQQHLAVVNKNNMYITYDLDRGLRTLGTNHEVVLVSEETAPDLLLAYVNYRRNNYDLQPLGLKADLCERAKRRASYMRRRPISSSYSKRINQVIRKPLLDSGEYLDIILSHNCCGLGISNYTRCIGGKDVTYTVQVLTMTNR
jgi:hypothetical protein